MVHTGWTVTSDGCWEWDGYRNPNGYGEIKLMYRATRCSRTAYETWVGPIPDGYVVRHKCDNPPCINPDHLEVGTARDNTQDMIRRGRDGIRGPRNGRTKLSTQQVDEIRREYEAGGVSQYALADTYGVTQATISKIVLRKARLYG